MRIPAFAAAVAGAATASLLFMAPAHAATAKTAQGPVMLPTYTCEAVIALRNFPPTVLGFDCQASNGAPAEGPVRGPFMIGSREPEEPGWICDFGNAGGYPERVVGEICKPA